MAKKEITPSEKSRKPAKTKGAPAPSSLVLKLGAPGMTNIHRAGLGGLAATLIAFERLGKKTNENFSWDITPTEITLNFGKPENARPFFEWLFKFAFQIQYDLIYLPGQYNESNGKVPPIEVRARLQQGVTLTFLQHNKACKLDGKQEKASYKVDDKTIEYTYQKCINYKRQSAWLKWIDKEGQVSVKDYEVAGTSYPGAVVRHNAYKTTTTIFQPLELVLPLAFAIVGTLSLPINDKTGVLIIPYIDDLTEFANLRAKLTPMSVQDTWVGGAGDAVLQLEIRRRADSAVHKVRSTGGDAILFRKVEWCKQQKTRAETLSIGTLDKQVLEFYQYVLSYLSPRIVQKKNMKKTGRGKNATTTEEIEYFWVDSVIRSFVANNLAQGKYWFDGFFRFAASSNPATKKPFWEEIKYEKKGLNAMVSDDKLDWKLDGARALVLAVHDALRCRYRQVRAKCKSEGINEAGMKNRFKGEYDKWRLAFAGAKTSERFRFSLSDMFSRAKIASELKMNWEKITQLLLQDWQLARDLALIGLASYKGKESDSQENTQSSDENDQ